MSKKSPISSKSSESEIYSFYSDLYNKRQGKVEKLGFSMRASKLDKNALSIYISGERERQAGKRWSTDQIIRNLVSRETSKFAYGSAKGIRKAIESGDMEAPEEWYDETGDLKLPSVLEVRMWAMTPSMDLNFDFINDEYHRFVDEGELLEKQGKLKKGETASAYARHKISQMYFGSP